MMLTGRGQAGGQIGEHIARQLVQTGRHSVTALTRPGSKNILPQGVKAVTVDYNDPKTLVDALQGQQFLVITLAVTAPPDTHSKLVQAAAKAGVPYVMPNVFGTDNDNKTLVKETPLTEDPSPMLDEIKATGVSSAIPMVCGLWYEYSLIMGPIWYGFDFAQKKLTLYDDGNTKISTTTWEQCGRAVAALASLKELPEDEADKSPTVSHWRNKSLVVSSFLISQRDMFDSWKRVTGDKDSDWTIEHESSKERYQQGIGAMQNAKDPLSERMGAAQASFVRIFYPNGGGDYERTRGLDNHVLGLPKEDLDERTAVAKKMLDEEYSAKVLGRIRAAS